jgi:DNA invertase Pin-like site-specific DNA recombinase
MVKDGEAVRPGDYLVVESLDRLTREHIRPALTLLRNLIDAGVRIVQLKPVEVVYDEDVEPMQLMMAVMELSRGNSESQVKSDRVGAKWREKKRLAREGKKQPPRKKDGRVTESLTNRLPAWVEDRDGKLVAVKAKADVVRLVFRLTAAGYGNQRIARKLNADGVPPLGGAAWGRSYVQRILADRRAVGELQPKGKGRKPEGPPVPGYYPQVVTEEEWQAAVKGRAGRVRVKDRAPAGAPVNVFANLMTDALDGSAYFLCGRNDRGRVYHVLSNLAGAEGRGKTRSFPYGVFEAAVVALLQEVKPGQIVDSRKSAADLLALLTAEDTRLARELKKAKDNLAAKGGSDAIFDHLRGLEAERQALAPKLEEAREKAAHPLATSWGAFKTLAAALDAADDPQDARVRLRSALRRICDGIKLLIVTRGLDRLAVAQFYFTDDGSRTYLVHHRSGRGGGFGKAAPATWRAASLPPGLAPEAAGLDLEDAAHVAGLREALERIDLADLAESLGAGPAGGG